MEIIGTAKLISEITEITDMAKTERCCKDVEVFKKELQEIATEMGLPIEDGEVLCEWGRRGNCYNDEVFIKFVYPTYFKKFGLELKKVNGVWGAF